MTYAAEVLADSPVRFWPLDETSGTVADDAMNNGDGTYTGGPTLGVAGLVTDGGNAVTTTSGGGYLSCPFVPPIGPGTAGSLEFWFTWISGNIIFRDHTSLAGTGTFLDLSGANPVVRFGGASRTITGITSATLKTGRHQCVITADGTNVKTYFDGSLVDTWARTATFFSVISPFYFGKNGNTAQFHPNTYDAISYYDGVALSAGRVAAHYTPGITTPPGVPTSVSASASGTTVTLTWSAPATGVAASYEVRIDGGSVTNVGLSTSHGFTGLSAGSHTAEVRAVNSAATSAWVSASATVVAAPGVPTSVTAAPGVDEIVLTWAAPTTGGAVTGYDVQLDSGTITDVGNVLTHTFTGLAATTSYDVKVRAYGAGGDSSFVSTIVSTIGPPGVPTDVDATATSTTAISLTWDPPAGSDPVDHYEVRIDGGTPTDVGTVETYGFTGLTPATEYTVEVRAVNGAGASAWVPVTLETPPPSPVDVYLRLEVEGDPPAGKFRNLLANPSGELGGAGWVTPTDGATLGGVPDPFDTGTVLEFTSGGGAETYFTSDAVPVTPGEFLWARWHVPTVDGFYQVLVEFAGVPTEFGEVWEAAEVPVSFSATGAVTGVDLEGGPVEIPVDSVKARLRVEHYSAPGGAPSAAGDTITLKRAGLTTTDTDDPIDWSDVVEVADLVWIDVLGPTHEIEVDRQALDLGTLTATILDATLDPASAEVLATGRGCRLTALSAMTGEWLPIFTGRIEQAKVTYDTRRLAINPDDPKTARITLTAHDATTQLAASPRPNGVGTVDELRAVLEGTGVPWNINGSVDQIAGFTVVSRNENASAVDQIAITRDSAAAYAWLDRYGVLQAWNREAIVDGAAVLLDESRYSDLVLTYDSESLINSVVITYLTYDPATGETAETKYGPYLAPSVGRRGERRAEFTLHGLTPDLPGGTDPSGAIAAFAAAVLEANAIPHQTCESVTIPIRNSGEVTTSRAFLDMYRLTRVVNTARGFDEDLRVTGVTHQISADPKRRRAKWNATYTFAPMGSVAAPQVTPPLPSNTGPLPWTAPTLTNGWVNRGSPDRLAGVKKVGGRVRIRGAVEDGTPGTQIFQLDVGYRPGERETFTVETGEGSLRLDVQPDGAVVPYTTISAFVSLAGVEFDADQ